MSDSITTKVERSYLDPDTQHAAVRYIERTGNSDVLEALGLADPPSVVINGRACCPVCRYPFRPDRGSCRRPSCSAGPASRGASR